ncbi:LOW QUALITY PROTEIN: hypothetical protein QTO34_004056 [Cnephaeus nilssonii]|uniref:Uncharacterized protein n=1 Tax=Cnephaeus nilssonii TaxID=3371016 RepID=A0AA40HRS3_CNENI|nr:LOW QUALITY PROTEIN: hypothetical protein QTO34_004056 [Eptesicus nilssonii]
MDKESGFQSKNLVSAVTHLGGTNLDFQMEESTYERKSDGTCIVSLKGIQEKLLLAALPLLSLKTPLTSVSYRPGIPASELCWNMLLPLEPLLLPTPSLLRASLTRSRQPSQSRDFCEASYVNWPAPALCSPGNKGAHSVGLMWWILAWEALRMPGTISHDHPREITPDFYVCRDPEETKGRAATAEKARNLRVNGRLWLPSSLRLSLRSQVSSVPIQQFPTVNVSMWPLFVHTTEDWSTQPPPKAGLQPPLLTEWCLLERRPGLAGSRYPGLARGTDKPWMAAAQPMPKVQASLRWWLPSHPGPPEAYIAGSGSSRGPLGSVGRRGQSGKRWLWGLSEKGLGRSGNAVLAARERKAHSSTNLHASGY